MPPRFSDGFRFGALRAARAPLLVLGRKALERRSTAGGLRASGGPHGVHAVVARAVSMVCTNDGAADVMLGFAESRMSLPVPLHRYPYSEYVALEELSAVRHEFVAGEIYAMAGGTPEHAALAASALRHLGNQLPEGCRTYTSDLRVRIEASDVTTYPDGAVVCGKVVRAADDPLAATNPIVVLEVTSPSTEDYDRGPKLEIYKALPSVREVLILSHVAPEVVVHRRAADGTWSAHESRRGDVFEVESVGARIAVDDVYRDLAGE